MTIDSGLKFLTTESGHSEVKGKQYTHGVLGDEHGSLSWESGTPDLNVSDRVEMAPSRIDPTVNLHSVYHAYRRGVVEEIWKFDTRGKV